MTRREAKEDDDSNTRKALVILTEAIKINPGIDDTLWMSAALNLVAHSFINTGLSYEQFCEEMDLIKDLFKSAWED